MLSYMAIPSLSSLWLGEPLAHSLTHVRCRQALPGLLGERVLP